MHYTPDYIKKISDSGFLLNTGMCIFFYPTGIYILNRMSFWIINIVFITIMLVALPLQGQIFFGIIWGLIVAYHGYVLIKTNNRYLPLLR